MTVAHSLLIAIFFVLPGKQFVDLGADYYTNFNLEKKINSHVKQLSKLGVNIPEDVLHNIMIEALRNSDNSRTFPHIISA